MCKCIFTIIWEYPIMHCILTLGIWSYKHEGTQVGKGMAFEKDSTQTAIYCIIDHHSMIPLNHKYYYWCCDISWRRSEMALNLILFITEGICHYWFSSRSWYSIEKDFVLFLLIKICRYQWLIALLLKCCHWGVDVVIIGISLVFEHRTWAYCCYFFQLSSGPRVFGY